MSSNNLVSIIHNDKINYSISPPYNPPEIYPEYPLKNKDEIDKTNTAYEAVREVIKNLGFDRANFGTKTWNPLKGIVKPEDSVIIKPNFVDSKHQGGSNLFSVITHPSVIRSVIDFVYIALKDKGRIIICDAPEWGTDFNQLLSSTKLREIAELYKRYLDFEIEIYDLREYVLDMSNNQSFATTKDIKQISGDPLGWIEIDLKDKSKFNELSERKIKQIYGAYFNRKETINAHGKTHNKYLISKTILSCDVIINIPKLKTHKKGGVTLNLKNLVGLNCNKNYLPHYRLGPPSKGGDQYPETNKVLNKLRNKIEFAIGDVLNLNIPFSKFIFNLYQKAKGHMYILLKRLGHDPLSEKSPLKLQSGNWYGNDTVWRMVYDLFEIVKHYDAEGRYNKELNRKLFSIIDGVIAGEGDGPHLASERKTGVLLAGIDFVNVDLAAIELMGFDYHKIKPYSLLMADRDVNICYNGIGNYDISVENLKFKPASGWINNIAR